MSNIFAPFEPEPDERRRRAFRAIPLRALLPNLITLLSLCLGLSAIRLAMEARFEFAVGCIVLAAILDGLDGRIARLLQSTSRFGAELDSLADFVNFGVAPGILLYAWGLGQLRSVGWIAALIFAICAALRLARFNVMLEDPNRPAFAGNFFVGIPAPAGAIVVMLPLYMEFLGLPRTPANAPFASLYVVAIALLMVSWLPTWSGKRLGSRVPREYVLPVFVAVATFTALLLSYPWEVLTIGSLFYLGHVPFAYWHYARLERAHIAAAGGLVQPQSAADEDRPGRLN
jgi:CDP-diacylglycerol---serine O-phosphatidyltransferase